MDPAGNSEILARGQLLNETDVVIVRRIDRDGRVGWTAPKWPDGVNRPKSFGALSAPVSVQGSLEGVIMKQFIARTALVGSGVVALILAGGASRIWK